MHSTELKGVVASSYELITFVTWPADHFLLRQFLSSKPQGRHSHSGYLLSSLIVSRTLTYVIAGYQSTFGSADRAPYD
jgi:hypothetical protein